MLIRNHKFTGKILKTHYKEVNTFHTKKIQKNKKKLITVQKNKTKFITEYFKCNPIYSLS